MGLTDFLSKLFGNKAQRDMKSVRPYIEKIRMVYPSIQSLSDDELRQKTLDIRAEIQQYVAEETQQIADLKAQIEGQEIEQREKTYAEIDKLEKAKVDKFEVILNEKLPEVFSIVKETARRFSENE